MMSIWHYYILMEIYKTISNEFISFQFEKVQ